MKVKNLLKRLNSLVERKPEVLEFEAIYSSDDEGNSYHIVHSTGTSIEVEDLTDYHLEVKDSSKNPNALIIN